MIIRYNLFDLHKTKSCDSSPDPPKQGGSDDGSQHMFSMRHKEKKLSI